MKSDAHLDSQELSDMKTNSAVEKDIIASSRRRGRGVRLRVVTLSMAGLLLLVSQVISDNAIANSRSIADCMRSAPYSAQEFLEKLLIVVDDQNPAAFPKRFESTFGMKLRGVSLCVGS